MYGGTGTQWSWQPICNSSNAPLERMFSGSPFELKQIVPLHHCKLCFPESSIRFAH
jgi:hypothetical protein